MSRLFREKGGQEDAKRATNGSSTVSPSEDLPSPFGELGCSLSTAELRETAYEIFVAVSRTTGGKPLTYISQADRSPAGGTPEKSLSPSLSTVSPSSASPSLQRTLTATAASKVKKALGLKSKNSPGKESSPSKPPRKPMTVGELVRFQLGFSEQMDARIRRGLLRVSAGQVKLDLSFFFFLPSFVRSGRDSSAGCSLSCRIGFLAVMYPVHVEAAFLLPTLTAIEPRNF